MWNSLKYIKEKPPRNVEVFSEFYVLSNSIIKIVECNNPC